MEDLLPAQQLLVPVIQTAMMVIPARSIFCCRVVDVIIYQQIVMMAIHAPLVNV
jgi:hypothetical protein